MITDSGANQSILGAQWHIVSQSDRTTTVEGWAPEMKKDDMRIASGLTKTTLPNGTSILLLVNEAVNLGTGDSLLSSNQVGSYGIHVDDDLFFGTGHIITSERHGMDVPLESEGALTFVRITAPTENDIEQLHIVQLTDDAAWDPYGISIPRAFANLTRAEMRAPTTEHAKIIQRRFGH